MLACAQILDVITYNGTPSACDNGCEWQLASSLMTEMTEKRLSNAELDFIAFTAMISACAESKQWRYALFLLEDMRHNRLAPNRLTYNASVSACEKAGRDA